MALPGGGIMAPPLMGSESHLSSGYPDSGPVLFVAGKQSNTLFNQQIGSRGKMQETSWFPWEKPKATQFLTDFP